MHSNHAPEEKALYEAIVSLETPEECARFFQDICTIKEVQAMAQRLAVCCQAQKRRPIPCRSAAVSDGFRQISCVYRKNRQ